MDQAHRLDGKRSVAMLGDADVSAFPSHFVVELNVAAATQYQALAPLPFLYLQVMGIELPWLDAMLRA